MHFYFREAPGSLCEPSGEGSGKLSRSLWEVLPGEAPGVGFGKLCRSLLEGSKCYWEALWEGPAKLRRSLLGRVERDSWEAPVERPYSVLGKDSVAEG